MPPMTIERRYAGGCMCGAVRWSTTGEPAYQGYCCCADCRRASGSGFVPFMGFAAKAVTVTGETLKVRSPAFRGGTALRNACPTCASLVFGGEVGIDDSHTIYAGSLDDPSLFSPTMVLFLRDKPDWVVLPEGLTKFETMPD